MITNQYAPKVLVGKNPANPCLQHHQMTTSAIFSYFLPWLQLPTHSSKQMAIPSKWLSSKMLIFYTRKNIPELINT